MTISRKQLLEAVKSVLPGIATGNVLLDGADALVFDKGMLYTYNDSISVSRPFIPDEGEEPLTGSVKAAEFFQLISRLPAEELKLVAKDESWVIKAGEAKATLKLMANTLLEHVSKILPKEDTWQPLPERFQEALSWCKFSCNRSALSGIFLSGKFMNSTDEMRINRFELDAEVADAFWIADPAAGELMKIANLKEYALTESWAHFKTDEGAVFSCKRLQHDKYPAPKLNKLIDSHEKVEGDVGSKLPASLSDVVDRASAFSQDIDGSQIVQLTFGPADIEVFTERSSGKYQERIAWEEPLPDFSPITVFVDPAMVINGLRRSKQFYIHSVEVKGRMMNRIMVVGEFGRQLIQTVMPKDE